MVASHENSLGRKPGKSRGGVNSIREVLRRLTCVASLLVHLAGCGFDMQEPPVIDSLLYGGIDHCRMG